MSDSHSCVQLPAGVALIDVFTFTIFCSLKDSEPFDPNHHIGDYDPYNDCEIESEDDYYRYLVSRAKSELLYPAPVPRLVPPPFDSLLKDGNFAPAQSGVTSHDKTKPTESNSEIAKKAKWFTPLCVLSCALVLLVCLLGCVMAQMQNTISQQEVQVAELAVTVDSLQTENSTLESQRSSAAHWVKQLTSERAKLNAEISQLQEENDFWEGHAVIVVQEGSRYHRQGCSHIRGKDFWIYNVEAAKGHGYTPCLDCNPPSEG